MGHWQHREDDGSLQVQQQLSLPNTNAVIFAFVLFFLNVSVDIKKIYSSYSWALLWFHMLVDTNSEVPDMKHVW